ncbi:UDP-glucosyltransferase 2-like [Uranotaenia lowii]|uniref:UDP-glucosyltransferase 2-like n=1 Tax=Uranotaenia lowii TaxID=190385 RepID=UPI002479FE83|nr:UDP-glucosyltransferase 2-like [Uranotaenia lowii]
MLRGGSLGWIVGLVLIGHLAEGARILAIFPSPAKSHQIVFRAVVRGLLEKGHQVLMMTTDPFETDNPNVTQISWDFAHRIVDDNFDVAKLRQNGCSSLEVAWRLMDVTRKFVAAELAHPEVQYLIENPHLHQFDVLLVEYFHMTPFFAFSELYQIPMVGITSIDSIGFAHQVVGNVMNVVAHPEMNQKYAAFPGFFNRLWAVLEKLFIDYILLPIEFSMYDRIIDQNFGSNMSKSYELMQRLDFLMTNVEPVLGFVRPTVPQAIQLGLLHVQPAKALPNDLQLFLDNSKQGVVYFSLGSLIKSGSINAHNNRIFMEVFQSLDMNVLWKSDQPTEFNGTGNIWMNRWFPQQDVLAHPNVKLFVTQGGQQSMEESVDRHVPMVVIPFNFDQYANGDRVTELGIGKSIWMEHLTVEGLREAIIEVTSNKK